MSTEEGTITRKRSFAQIPDDLVTDRRLSANAVRVWARLDKYAGTDGRAYPSRDTLAADLGLSVRNVARALAELLEAGWISREIRDGKSALTRLHDRSTRATGGTAPVPPVARPRAARGTRPVPPVAHEGIPTEGIPTEEDSATSSRGDTSPGHDLALFDGPAEPARTTTAQTLVGEWIDHCAKRPPRTVIGQVGKHLGAFLEEGIDPDDVRRGLVAWARKGSHPSALPSFVNEVMNARPTGRSGQDVDWSAALDRAAAREASE